METMEDSEQSHLINERTYSLKQKREASATVELSTVGSHCHGNQVASSESYEKTLAKNKLYMASIICLVFMIGEVVGGYLAHSLAIMTDAAHLLTDFGSMLVSLFSLWVSSRPPTKTMSFGWHRSVCWLHPTVCYVAWTIDCVAQLVDCGQNGQLVAHALLLLAFIVLNRMMLQQ